MFKIRLVLIFLLAVIIMAPVQAGVTVVDDMTSIITNGWTDVREPAEGGIGLLQQGTGVMVLDYGNTTDSAGIPDPLSGWDYLGVFVGIGAAGGAFDSGGAYLGKKDRELSAIFPPGFFSLSTDDAFTIDVYKPLAGYSGHVRELQLYDGLGNRNTYIVIGEGGTDLDSPGGPGRTIMNTPAGWKTYTIPLNTPIENNADLSDIVNIRIWASSWAAYANDETNPYDPGTQPVEYAAWPKWENGDMSLTPESGLPLLIDTLKLLQCIVVVNDMDDISTNGWADDRDTQEQARPGWMSQGSGTMKIDYGVTNDTDGIPNPSSGYDYLGAFVGVGAAGGAFDSGDVYLGDYDRVPSATFPPGFFSLSTDDTFYIDVYKPLPGYSGHVRELQLYDSSGNRNTYIVTGEGGTDLDSPGGPGRTIINTPAGWTTYVIPLNAPAENNADLSDISVVKIWVSSWAAYANDVTNPYDSVTQPTEYLAWPRWENGDMSLTPFSGLPVLIDNLKLCPGFIDGDINFDCTVDFFDFTILAGNWLED